MSEKIFDEILELIIQSVNLHHVDRAHISRDTFLGKGGLNLDSVDILEVVVAIEQKYGMTIRNAEEGSKYFRTIGTIVDFVSNKPSA